MEAQEVRQVSILKALGKALEKKSSGEIQIDTHLGSFKFRMILVVAVVNYDVDRSMTTLDNMAGKPVIYRCGVVYDEETRQIEIRSSEGSSYYIEQYEELIYNTFAEITY